MSDKIQLLNNIVWIIAVLVALFVWKADIVIDLSSEETLKIKNQMIELKGKVADLEKYLGLDK